MKIMATATKKAASNGTTPTKVQDTPAAVNWDALPDAETVEYTRVTGGKPSIADTTPQIVKDRVSSAFVASTEAGKPVYKSQACGSVDAAEFEKLMRRWARSIEKTVKGKVVEDRFVYAVVTAEKRTRKPAVAVVKP
jgi:hypothetical protein